MAKNALLLLVLAALLCSVASARILTSSSSAFIVQGRVFCDTCRAGFETPATTFMPGARVKVECHDRATNELRYTAEGITDLTGTYNIFVAGEHENQICESSLVSSPDAGCAQAVPGRDRARVVLTHNNGIPSNVRLANSMGFQKDSVLAGCAEVMKLYQQEEDV